MEVERAIARLAEACSRLEAVAIQRSDFYTRRAERMRSDKLALQRTNEQLAQGLDGAIARLRTVLGG